jgi:hypothetical protein
MVIGCFRYSEHFVRQDIVDSKRLVGHAIEAQPAALRPINAFLQHLSDKGPREHSRDEESRGRVLVRLRVVRAAHFARPDAWSSMAA